MKYVVKATLVGTLSGTDPGIVHEFYYGKGYLGREIVYLGENHYRSWGLDTLLKYSWDISEAKQALLMVDYTWRAWDPDHKWDKRFDLVLLEEEGLYV